MSFLSQVNLALHAFLSSILITLHLQANIRFSIICNNTSAEKTIMGNFGSPYDSSLSSVTS